jgi:hypothetical protein
MLEAKGSRSETLSFMITRNELRAATQFGDQYEVHYWGGVRLDLDPRTEFDELVQRGYPIVISNPARRIEENALTIECASWQVREPTGQAGT